MTSVSAQGATAGNSFQSDAESRREMVWRGMQKVVVSTAAAAPTINSKTIEQRADPSVDTIENTFLARQWLSAWRLERNDVDCGSCWSCSFYLERQSGLLYWFEKLIAATVCRKDEVPCNYCCSAWTFSLEYILQTNTNRCTAPSYIRYAIIVRPVIFVYVVYSVRRKMAAACIHGRYSFWSFICVH